MPLWNGETWLCEEGDCRTVNAVLRKRCRSCGAISPGPIHPDRDINREVQAEMQANAAHDISLGLCRG